MLRPAAVIWSKVPVIDTFGAGGGVCANAGSTGIAIKTAINASTAVTRLLLITASSVVVRSSESCASTQRRHHQQLQLRSRDRNELVSRGSRGFTRADNDSSLGIGP